MEEAFDSLDAPVERIASLDVPIPCTPAGIAAVYRGPRCRRRGREAGRVTLVTLERLSIAMEDGKVLRWLVSDGAAVESEET